MHVHKSSIDHILFLVTRNIEPSATQNTRFVQFLQKQLCPLRTRAIIALEPCVIFLHLKPTTGLHMIKGLSVESWPIPDGAAYRSGMNQVEFLAVEPFVFGIVDFEAAIWRDPVLWRFISLSTPVSELDHMKSRD